MKKLFGMVILAVLPVACGSLPSSPDASGILTSDNAAVSAQANRPSTRPAPAPLPTPGCSIDANVEMDGIEVSVLNDGARSVTLRADAVILHSDRPSPCFTPVWSVVSAPRGVTLTADKLDPQVATFSAPAGRYAVQAVFNATNGSRIVGQASVTIR